ncbi:hypothetical protein [Paenibacillus thalictri]|uniref:Uncharacterized protein n=1 Tax=Paenibacillus thalictri TaxID=2527873 RepID=A0A4Q9DJ00_9BACL|nr:hypothetical protein [Paenibacillus thalictri]TBL71233.1 hypothetical protein EYB31_31165 [Paenibacillus thalictri]
MLKQLKKIMKRIARTVVAIVFIGTTLQMGLTAYRMAEAESGPSSVINAEQPAAPISSGNQQEAAAVREVQISQAVLDKIREESPARFDQSVSDYKNLLAKIDAHQKVQDEIEQLILAGYRLPDLLIALEFLNDEYAQIQQMELLLKDKQAGKSWAAVFKSYHDTHASFVPRAFDSDELETLLTKSGLTSDDLMIADRISFETGEAVKQLIASRKSGGSWKDIKADRNIINSAAALPRVPLTAEQLNYWMQAGNMIEDQVAAAFVLAFKTGEQPENVIQKLNGGSSQEAILAESYQSKYE